jgi:hypothetical protein
MLRISRHIAQLWRLASLDTQTHLISLPFRSNDAVSDEPGTIWFPLGRFPVRCAQHVCPAYHSLQVSLGVMLLPAAK